MCYIAEIVPIRILSLIIYSLLGYVFQINAFDFKRNYIVGLKLSKNPVVRLVDTKLSYMDHLLSYSITPFTILILLRNTNSM